MANYASKLKVRTNNWLIEKMLQSTLDENIVVHRFSGDFSIRDMIEAKLFATARRTIDAENHCVLWDLREATFSHPDDAYQAFASSVVDADAISNQGKRAFLMGSKHHQEKAERILGSSTIPWPWAIFESEKDANAWLKG